MKNIVIICLMLCSVSLFAQRNTFKNLTEKDGKIGIGTEKPDELLTVKGKIHTQEVLVDLNGAVAPDYVFEHYFEGASKLNPTYALLSLEEVAAYIEKAHHLPGIPSAQQLEANGISLKEMNLLLLQKIEELTLYTLEQQIQLDTIMEELEKLNSLKD
ncbi:MAG: hypothetical protein K8F54_12440 [Altibacter sp.]|uniref:tail fiber protein n=1 Tax=Altibacter sp. TaxID=2024823 RepID=UPI001DABD6E5|nr:tail fiber protein [Altibacter sp.]MBZ0328410.1 hypothetical protein [Altibacter sp.]